MGWQTVLPPLKHGTDPSQLAVHTGTGNNGIGIASSSGSACMHHILSISDWDILLVYGYRILVYCL